METFQFGLLKIVLSTITRVNKLGVVNALAVVAKYYSSFSKLIAKLTALPSVQWVKVILQHDELMQTNLFKVTVSVRGEPKDAINIQ